MATSMLGHVLVRRIRIPTFTARREHRAKRKWAFSLPAVSGSRLALQYFDTTYSLQLAADWPSVRIALLSEQKYGALVNAFSKMDAVMAKLTALRAADLLSHAHLRMDMMADSSPRVTADSSPYVAPSADSSPRVTSADSSPHGASADSSPHIALSTDSSPRVTSADSSPHVTSADSSPHVTSADSSPYVTSAYPSPHVTSADSSPYVTSAYPSPHVTSADSSPHVTSADPSPHVAPSTDPSHVTSADPSPEGAEQRRGLEAWLGGPALSCYTFPRGDISRFPSPRMDMEGLLGYYLMDAASLLPVLALNVQPEHRVLDLCAAPGGKSLALLMHDCGFLAANDVSISRTNRLRRVLQSYLPRQRRAEERVRVTSWDGTEWAELGAYDRVLVDAPCTNDRHSLMQEDNNNIFIRRRMKERHRLPDLQTKLLVAGLRAVTPGGDVVYSTCSMSQLQNECVVERALDLAASEYGIHAHIAELRPFRQLFSDTFNFHTKCRIGEMVLPHLTANYGPMYFCLLRRVM